MIYAIAGLNILASGGSIFNSGLSGLGLQVHVPLLSWETIENLSAQWVHFNYKLYKETKMAKKEKPLCKWKGDDINKKFDKFSDIVRNPKFVCKKCGRVADKKKWLHKPAML